MRGGRGAMRTSPDCLACFRDQARATAGLSSNDPEIKARVEREVDRLLGQLDLSLSPPENAVAVYALIAGITGVGDPYEHLRKKSNSLALSQRESIRDQINRSDNPFKTAALYAVAANIIDYGAGHDFDAIAVLSDCLQRGFNIDDTVMLLTELQSTSGCNVLYLADNSGEIVFDGLLVEQLQKLGCTVTFAVRETPILNDVTMEDAAACGIDAICHVIANGTGCPGTPLSACSDSFRSAFSTADVIISKGQGNFETLSDMDGPIYFLLTIKCPVVGRHIADLCSIDGKHRIDNREMIVMKRSK